MKSVTTRLTSLVAFAIASSVILNTALADDAKKTKPKAKEGKKKWIALFNGKDLNGWKKTKFGGEGDIAVKDGQLIIESGVDLTGVTWTKKDKLPLTNYEIVCEAKRVDGNDFFCGLTFPVKKDPCSLIIGGWGGGLCGLSSIDGGDASENETTTYQTFKKNQWYKIRLRVTDKRIEAWIDKKQIVDQDIFKRKIGIRIEVELSKPLGLATWQTTAAIRKLQVRKLTKNELATLDKADKKNDKKTK